MYKLYASTTFNTTKVLYVLEELDASYEIEYVDVFDRENRPTEYLEQAPYGKIPIFFVGDETIFESATICRYITTHDLSPLYPTDAMQRAKVDQWIDFFNCHTGRWLTTLIFERMIKKIIGREEDQKTCDEALGFLPSQLKTLDEWLTKHTWLAGDNLSIADFFALAYLEHADEIGVDLAPYPQILKWLDALNSRPSVKSARTKLDPYIKKAA